MDESFRQHALKHCAKQERLFSWKSTAARAYDAFQEAVARRHVQLTSQAKERPRYILVPALESGEKDLTIINQLNAALSVTGEVLLTAPHARKLELIAGKPYASVDPEVLQINGNHRIIILANSAKLDLYQCAILSRLPVVIVSATQVAQLRIPAAWRYHLEGYSGLIAAANSSDVNISLDALPSIFHQILGVIHIAGNSN